MLDEAQLYTTIGARIKQAREQSNVTQDQLARLVGLSRASISNIEHGRQQIQLHTLYAIAESLRWSACDLLPPTNAEAHPDSWTHLLPPDTTPNTIAFMKRIIEKTNG